MKLLTFVSGAIFFGVVGVISVQAKASSAEASEAFYVSPMEIHLRPASKNSAPTAKLRVVNKDGQAARVRVDVFERTDALDGSEQRAITRDVRVDTGEFTIAAGATKTLTVSYHGSSKLSRERAFRVVVKQVEYLVSEASPKGTPASLDLRFVYVASVYVTPERAESQILVKETRQTSEREIEVDMRNDGRAHQKMSDVDTVVEQIESGGKSRQILLSEETRQMLSRQNLLAGSRRKLVLQIASNERLTSGTPLIVKLVRTNTTGR